MEGLLCRTAALCPRRGSFVSNAKLVASQCHSHLYTRRHYVDIVQRTVPIVYGKRQAFTPPDWAKVLPREDHLSRVQLAMLPTPIHQWMLPGQPNAFQLAIKRDDLTGSALSGNKIRKLEFLLADAQALGCDSVITCGDIQSNHCRSTAVAARELGLDCYLVLMARPEQLLQSPEELTYYGNQLSNRLCGAGIVLVPPQRYQGGLKLRMATLAQCLREERNSKAYLIPVGGTSEVGMWGYIWAFHEMMEQGILNDYDDLVFACSSAGIAHDLAIANYLAGSQLRIHAVAVCHNETIFHEMINDKLVVDGPALADVRSEDIIHIIDGYVGKGYAQFTREEIEFQLQVSRKTGVILDPTYTNKAALALVGEMRKNPGHFKGDRILFVHTGGLLSLYDMRTERFLRQADCNQRTVTSWPDPSQPPPLPII